jgi:hypothetical protein
MDETLAISRDVHDMLSKIYDEFYKDFETRKELRRVEPLAEVQQYSILVDNSYLKEYQGKVRQVVLNGRPEAVYASLKENARNFVVKLKASLCSVKETYSRLMSLHDAYHVTLNVSAQLGKITFSLFQCESCLSCERLNLAYLCDAVCGGLEGTLQWARSQTYLPGPIEKVLDIVDRLLEEKDDLVFHTGPLYDLQQFDLYSRQFVEDIPLWRRPINELVEFISPSTKKSKRKRRKGKSEASTASASPIKTDLGDLEVENFKLRLACQRPAQYKVRPNLHTEWLRTLRVELEDSREACLTEDTLTEDLL